MFQQLSHFYHSDILDKVPLPIHNTGWKERLMGLPTRRHRIKIRMPEYFGIGLMLVLFVVCFLTFGQLTKLNWVKTSARIIGVSTPSETNRIYSPISSTTNGISVLYEFEANNQLIKGRWSSNWISSPIVKVLAPELINTIESVQGIDIRSVTKFGAEELNVNNEATKAATNVELANSLRGEDFYSVSNVRRKTLGGIMPSDIDASSLRQIIIQKSLAPEERVMGLLGVDRDIVKPSHEISIRFDPNNPEMNTLNYPGFNFRIPVVLLNLFVAAFTLRYFTNTYPSLKVRGY